MGECMTTPLSFSERAECEAAEREKLRRSINERISEAEKKVAAAGNDMAAQTCARLDLLEARMDALWFIQEHTAKWPI